MKARALDFDVIVVGSGVVGATLAAQAGATTKELMSRLGHTTPGMAMRYQIAAQERDAKIAEAMSKLAAQA